MGGRDGGRDGSRQHHSQSVPARSQESEGVMAKEEIEICGFCGDECEKGETVYEDGIPLCSEECREHILNQWDKHEEDAEAEKEGGGAID